MLRFRGEALPERPRLAVMVSDKVGNFVVASTLLRGLRERFPGCTVDYVTDGTRSDGFARASPLVDRLRRAYASLLVVQVLADWRHAPTGLGPAHHPPLLVAALTVAALAVAGWAVCDGLAALRWCSRTAAAP